MFNSASAVESHKRSVHGAMKLQCPTCNGTYSYEYTLKSHIKKCQSLYREKFKCLKCDRIYSEKRSLDVHVAAKHLGRTHVCELCGDTFSYRSTYKKHLELKHS